MTAHPPPQSKLISDTTPDAPAGDASNAPGQAQGVAANQATTALPPTAGFRLVRYFIVASFAAFVLVAVPLVYFERTESDFFRQVQLEQNAFFAQVQDGFAERHDAAAHADLLGVHEAGSVNLTRLLANALWDKDFAPLVAKAQRIPVAQCRAIADVKDAGGKTVPPGEKKACYTGVGKQIMALPEFRALDAKVFDTMKKSAVFKIKMYDLRGITVYSSEHNQIGENQLANAGWQSAVAGKPGSKLIHRDKFNAFDGMVESRDLIEVYLPVMAPGSDKIVAVIEVYSDVTQFLEQVKNTSSQMQKLRAENQTKLERVAAANQHKVDEQANRLLAIVLGLLALLYCALFLIVRHGQRIIDKDKIERERAEEALRASEQDFRTLVDRNPHGVQRIDIFGTIIFANKAHHEMYGYEEGALIGRSITDFLVPGSQRDELPGYLGMLVKDQPLPTLYQQKILRKNGEERDIEVIWDYLRDTKGNVEGFLSTLTDITERKRVEERLRENEEYFKSLANMSSDWFWEQDANLRFTRTIGGHRLRASISAEDAIGKTRWEIPYAGLTEEQVRQHNALLEARQPFRDFEFQRPCTDGSLRYRSISGEPVYDSHGNFKGYRGFGRDITERKRIEDSLRESEERFRMAFERAPVGVCLASPEGYFLRANGAFCRMLGYAESELLAKTYLEVTYPDDVALSYEWVRQLVAGKATFLDLEKRYLHAAGHIVWGSVRTFLMRKPDGSPLFFIAHIQDITERKRAENELQTSHEQLRALAARLTGAREEETILLAREIHDELGQALTGLKMDLSWFASRLGQDRRALKKKADSMLGLVDTTIGSIRNIATRLRPKMLDDLGLVAAIEWQAQEFRKHAGVKCELVSSTDTAKLGPEQSIAVFRIAQEALTNVARHAAATKVDISLHEDPGCLILEIRDNGRGIRAEEIASNEAIGLLGMRERAIAVGGKLAVEGFPGRGTVVTLRVPFPAQ